MPNPPDNDPASLAPYAGPKREFLAMVPWVTPDAPRAALRATQAKLASGSGDPLENDYPETVIAADLPFPPDSRRRNCISRPDDRHGHHHQLPERSRFPRGVRWDVGSVAPPRRRGLR